MTAGFKLVINPIGYTNFNLNLLHYSMVNNKIKGLVFTNPY